MKLLFICCVITLNASAFAQTSVDQQAAQIQEENNARRIEAEQKRAEITNRVNARRAQLEQVRASELQRAQQLREEAAEEGN